MPLARWLHHEEPTYIEVADLKLHIVSVSYQGSVNLLFFDFSQVLLRFDAQFSSKQ